MCSSGSNGGFAVGQTWIQVLALPFTNRATLGESFHLVGPSVSSGEVV